VELRAPEQVVAALREAQRLIPATTLVVHTRFWAIALGRDAGRFAGALRGAVEAAATRYRLGDRYDAADLAATSALPRHAGGAGVVEAVASALPDAVGVAAFDLDTPTPTTIGLGDTFVGGFLAELARQRSSVG
jgi:ADP-dependent phosphofructokinase/glucokinase